MHVEGGEVRLRAGRASSTPWARRRAAWRGARCARSRISLARQAAVSASMRSIDCSILAPLDALRAPRRPALYARAAPQPLHQLHLARLDDRHRARRRALIVVLSVMNGFQKEVRTRILGVASHVADHAAAATRLPTGRRSRRMATRASARGRRRAVRAGAGDARRRGRRCAARSCAASCREHEDKVADLGQHMMSGLARRAEARRVRHRARRRPRARAAASLPGDKVALIAPQGAGHARRRDAAAQAVHAWSASSRSASTRPTRRSR